MFLSHFLILFSALLARVLEYMYETEPYLMVKLQSWNTGEREVPLHCPDPLWLRVVVPIRVLSMSLIELLNYLLRIIIKYLKPYNCVQIIWIR